MENRDLCKQHPEIPPEFRSCHGPKWW